MLHSKWKDHVPKETPSFRNAPLKVEELCSQGNTILQECFPKLKGKVLKSHSPLKSIRSSVAKTNDDRGACWQVIDSEQNKKNKCLKINLDQLKKDKLNQRWRESSLEFSPSSLISHFFISNLFSLFCLYPCAATNIPTKDKDKDISKKGGGGGRREEGIGRGEERCQDSSLVPNP